MTRPKQKDLIDLAFEKALFDNTNLLFDIRLQDPEIKAKFKELIDLYVKKFCGNLSDKKRKK